MGVHSLATALAALEAGKTCATVTPASALRTHTSSQWGIDIQAAADVSFLSSATQSHGLLWLL